MFRTFLAALIVSALVLSAWSATAADSAVRTEAAGTVAASSKPSPLPPGGAAGVKKAQGLEGDSYWLEAGLAIGAFVLIWVLMGIGDNDDEATTTTTSQ